MAAKYWFNVSIADIFRYEWLRPWESEAYYNALINVLDNKKNKIDILQFLINCHKLMITEHESTGAISDLAKKYSDQVEKIYTEMLEKIKKDRDDKIACIQKFEQMHNINIKEVLGLECDPKDDDYLMILSARMDFYNRIGEIEKSEKDRQDILSIDKDFFDKEESFVIDKLYEKIAKLTKRMMGKK